MTELEIRAYNKKTGTEWTVNLEWLRQKLGVCNLSDVVDSHWEHFDERICRLWEQISDINTHLIESCMSQARDIILRTFKQGDLNTRQLHDFIDKEPLKLKRCALHKAFEQLVAEKNILFISQGRGHPRKWFLADDPLALVLSKEDKS